ncbi:ABC-type antimicrobial peptide transport system permease subunit [Mucilaginibacter frigoritolerans]|uniref:ABC-type antimicrobial peptide transport system permease subunit n=1 Tax=Mucilaginibacter frigoritolerans TaxID=652788 RepID=A0A562TZY0_9SPHI|nr:ABC transporter permease [Mucilaginibacter frigoritolerans]TWI98674.1 ABC-type antimicrobial peptide transport system permease subunit [Mucilaginibacter frigoritolerans]
MIKNYLKIAFRSFGRHKLFTLINIVGLSIGISAALVIYLIVHYDFTFDKFHKDEDRIYRVVSDFSFQGQQSHTSGVCGPLAGAIKSQATGVEFTAPIFTLSPDVFIAGKKNGPTRFKAQNRVILADQQYFKIFNYVWLAGSSAHALDAPNHVVLTSERAKLYFPSLTYDQIIGKVVTYDTLKTTVSGIVQTIKENTDLSFHDFISYSTGTVNKDLGGQLQLTEWESTNSASEVFIKLFPKTAPNNVQKQLNAILKKSSQPHPELSGSTHGFRLQTMDDIHFNADYGVFDFSSTASKTTLYGLLVIAAFLLLLGCINFVNLTTAQAAQRAKEIGIRKTMGSSRRQLIVQFLSETFIVTLLAVLISVMLAPFILKLFADFIPKDIKVDFAQPSLILFLLGLTVVVSMASGFYPAIMLSSYKPVLVLKNQASSKSSKTRNAWLRKSLTVTQFIIAQFFIMATVLVSKQIYYALHKDLGFKKDAIIVIDSPWKNRTLAHNQVLANKLRALPQIEMISMGSAAPSSGSMNSTFGLYKDGKKEIKTDVEIKTGDQNYIKIYQIKLLAGRNIQITDTARAIIINNTYAKILGFSNPADAIGKRLEKLNNDKNITIVGVVADFHERSLHSPINPLAILYAKGTYQTSTFHIALKPETVGGNEWKTAIAAMGRDWKSVYPDDDFDYHFYDETIAKFYDSERHTSTLLTWATGLSIFISCLGLLGLAIYTTNLRTKEIGVRKVLGATVTQIVTLLSTELVLLILLAFIIVSPIAWWAMNKWMENYSDRTTISWWIFALSGGGMLMAAVITSSFQTVKAAIANPVRSLRSE